MFSCVTPPVVDQIVRSLELLPTEVASVTKLGLVNQLMFLERMLQFKRHPAVLAGKISDVRVDLEVDVIGGYLVESFAALLTAPAVASNAVGPQVDVHTVTGLELLPALLAAVRTICNIEAHYNETRDGRPETRDQTHHVNV